MQIWFKLQNMGQHELLQHITPEEYEEIQNSHDAIEAYTVAHEGESKTNVVGEGNKILKWFADVIDAVKEKILPGTPVYHLHNSDNSNENRTAIGKVLKTFKTAQGKVVSVIRRFKDFLHLKTDVASFEAPLKTNAPDLDGHNVKPWEIGDITGIALGSSEINQPAFAGAVRKAFLQCFEKGESTMNLSEILTYIQEQKINPLQIFPEEIILELDPVKAALAAKKGSENLHFQNVRLQADLKAARDSHAKELEEKEKIIQDRDGKLLVYKVGETYIQELEKRKELTPQQQKYLELEREKLAIDPGKELPEQVNSHFDAKIKEFEERATIFNPELKDEKEKPGLPGPSGGNQSEMDETLEFLP